jgi:hypothetical protein
MRETTCFITSTGQGEPAMIPVRRLVRSKESKLGSASSAMNMVGTPYNEVQCSWATACSVAIGSKPGAGMTIVAPCVVQPRLPIVMPKQW